MAAAIRDSNKQGLGFDMFSIKTPYANYRRMG